MAGDQGVRVVVLSGAGVSAESGIATFRDSGGLWSGHRVEDVASPEGFARDPGRVQEFYDARRAQAQDAEPNAAHRAIADLAAQLQGDGSVVVVTQNVDDLHERAGSPDVIHIHGELNSALCTHCGDRHRWLEGLADGPGCPSCGRSSLRPDIVWFGEQVYRLDEIVAAVENCDVFLVVGTSSSVWPAAGLAEVARAHGAHTILVNAERNDDAHLFDDVRIGSAGVEVPLVVQELLARSASAEPR